MLRKSMIALAVVAILLIMGIIGVILEDWRPPPEVIIKTEYVEVEKIKIEFVDKLIEVPVLQISGYDYRYSDNTTMSAYEALQWCERGIATHQYVLDHPEYQTAQTGDSEFQWKVISEYQRAKELINKLTGGVQ